MQKTTTQPITSPAGDGSRKPNHEWRCNCGRLLFKGEFLLGIIEAKCPRCKRIVYLEQSESYNADSKSFMSTLSLEGDILTVSSGIKDTLGYEPEEVLGKNIAEFISQRFISVIGFWIDKFSELPEQTGRGQSLVLPLVNSLGEEEIISSLVRSSELGGKKVLIILGESGLSSADDHEREVLAKLNKKTRLEREGWDFIVDPRGKIVESSSRSELGFNKDELNDTQIQALFKDAPTTIDTQLNTQISFIAKGDLQTKGRGHKPYLLAFAPDFFAAPDEPAFIVSSRSLDRLGN